MLKNKIQSAYTSNRKLMFVKSNHEHNFYFNKKYYYKNKSFGYKRNSFCNYIYINYNKNVYYGFVSKNLSRRPWIYLVGVPKCLNSYEKKVYIDSYLNELYNSRDFVKINAWKPNSNGICNLKG